MEHKRKLQRLYGYDYSQNGLYFVTICTDRKRKILWENYENKPFDYPRVHYSRLGEIADEAVAYIIEKYSIAVDKYVIMPNHIHMIVVMPEQGTAARAAPTWTLSQVIGGYKSLVASEWLNHCKANNMIMGSIWQRSFYDHVIRSDNEYLSIWNYIDTNPIKWTDDEYCTHP